MDSWSILKYFVDFHTQRFVEVHLWLTLREIYNANIYNAVYLLFLHSVNAAWNTSRIGNKPTTEEYTMPHFNVQANMIANESPSK